MASIQELNARKNIACMLQGFNFHESDNFHEIYHNSNTKGEFLRKYLKKIPENFEFTDEPLIKKSEFFWRNFDTERKRLRKETYKKSRKESGEDEEEQVKEKKRVKHRVSPIVRLELPTEFRTRIKELGGSDCRLVIQKQLFGTDVEPNNNRFSIPLKQILDNQFINLSEEERLESKETIETSLIHPSLEIGLISLKKWRLSTKSSIYVLASSWNDVVRRNKLRENMIVQLWSFRRVGYDSNPWFALVRVKDEEIGGGEGGSGSLVSEADSAILCPEGCIRAATSTSSADNGN